MRTLIALTAAFFVGGCALGGSRGDDGGAGPDGAAEHGGRKCDAYEISVGGGWNVTAAMTSEYDNYLFLTKGEDVATNDDFDGLDARIDTDVEMAGMYTVYACAYADGRGAYTLTIATSAGN